MKNLFIIFIINFLKLFGFGHGKLKKINFIILKIYLKIINQNFVYKKYYGKYFKLYPLDNSTDGKILLNSKKLEKKELFYLFKLKKNSNSIFFDIGANSGFYSIFTSNYGFNKIYSFEPFKVMSDRLKENIKLNNLENLIEIIESPVGESDDYVDIYRSNSNLGGSSLILSNERYHETKLKMITLFSFVINNNIKNIDAIKIDIEGYEDRALSCFFSNAPKELFPKIIIIEHTSSKDWLTNIINDMVNYYGYFIICKTRSNSILELRN